MATAQVSETKPGMSKTTVVMASLIGSIIEWYDWNIFGTASALVFTMLFFPSFDPTVGTLLVFATFGAGSCMRPIGGMIAGHFGDRIGRKSMLIITLITTGIATFLIGVLPTYQQIGIWAGIILVALRLIQGLAFGGEWGGASLVAVENAPKSQRGFFGSFPQMGGPIANFMANGTFALLAVLPQDQFLSWGWRIPFLLSAVLVLVGLVFRLKLQEAPVFAGLVQQKELARAPLMEVLRNNLRLVLIGAGATMSTVVAIWVVVLFGVSYATQAAGLSRQDALHAVLVAVAAELIMLPIFAAISDRIGRKTVALFGAAVTVLTSFPFFWLINAGTFTATASAMVLSMVGISALYAVLPSYLSELFDARVRYSGISLSYTLSAGIVAGLTPIIASALYAWAHHYWPVAAFLTIIGLISCWAIGVGPSRNRLHEDAT